MIFSSHIRPFGPVRFVAKEHADACFGIHELPFPVVITINQHGPGNDTVADAIPILSTQSQSPVLIQLEEHDSASINLETFFPGICIQVGVDRWSHAQTDAERAGLRSFHFEVDTEPIEIARLNNLSAWTIPVSVPELIRPVEHPAGKKRSSISQFVINSEDSDIS